MKLFTVLALAVAIGLATAVSPFAASTPDGLERVAEDKAFIDTGKAQDGPIADYAFPGVEDERLATGLAGFTGTLIVFGLGVVLVKAARRRPATA
jgi:PDGLE domain